MSALVKLREDSSGLELWINQFLKDNGESADKDTAMRDRQKRRQVQMEIMVLNLLIDYINEDNEQIPGNESGKSTAGMTEDLALGQNVDLSVKENPFDYYGDALDSNSLSYQSGKVTFARIRSKNATTHSYTIQPMISLAGQLVGPIYHCLKELKGKMSDTQ